VSKQTDKELSGCLAGVCLCAKLSVHLSTRTGPYCMLQMVRTLAQFSIALEEMNESGENTGDEGGGGGGDCGGGGEEVVDKDAVDQYRNNNSNGNSGGNLNGNGLCAGSPNGEVDHFLSICCHPLKCVCVLLATCTLAGYLGHYHLPVQFNLDFTPSCLFLSLTPLFPLLLSISLFFIYFS